MANFAVILPAAGKSSRFSVQKRKKPFVELKGRPVWVRAAEHFLNRDDVSQVLLVVSREDIDWVKEKFRANLAFMNIEIVEGGAERIPGPDPAAYLTPDVTADFFGVTLTDAGPDRVLVRGGAGRARPGRLKASVGCRDGFIGEGQISYAGPDAVARGRLALEVVARRLELAGVAAAEIRCDLIGHDAILGPRRPRPGPTPRRSARGWRPGRPRCGTPSASATRWRRSTPTAPPPGAA